MAAVHTSPAAGAAPAPAVRVRRWPAFALGGVGAAALVGPLLYALVAFHTVDARFFAPPVLQHAALNWLANLIVMVSAFSMVGRFDEQLSALFRRVLAAHGAVAFFTLATRHYYSIPMMVAGAGLSIILGGAVAYLARKVKRPRVGILGPSHDVLNDPWIDCELVADPAAPIRDYHFLLVTWPGEPPSPWNTMLSRALLAGKRVRHVAEFLEDARGVVAIEHFDVDELSDARFASYRRGKRILDIALALACAPIGALVVVIAAAGIRLSMGGPAIYTQSRVGRGGRIFTMYKLRTMRPVPEGPTVATAPQDARITPMGRWLRRFRIDELPQLWNVLTGDMSIVGPRPEQPALAREYAAQTPAFAYRQLVRPGITGWAQVRAPYAANLAETRVKLGYDLFYLKHISLGLDIQILLRTVWTLLGGGGVR